MPDIDIIEQAQIGLARERIEWAGSALHDAWNKYWSAQDYEAILAHPKIADMHQSFWKYLGVANGWEETE